MNKRWGIILFLSLLFFPLSSSLASNAGFVEGNIWYSKDPFEDGDKIKIYTVIFNPDNKELSGTVLFFDNSTLLGKKDFIVPVKGVKDVSIDWSVTPGKHSIFAKIENSKFLVTKGKYEDIYIPENETEKNERTVSKKLVAKVDQKEAGGSNEIENIENFIVNATPDFIAKPIVKSAENVEEFRENTGASVSAKKEEVKAEIEELKSSDTKKPEASKNIALKPLKYVQLFFVALLAFIFNNSFIFYGLSALILFFIFRFFWRKFT